MRDEDRTRVANDMAFSMSDWEHMPRSFMLELRDMLEAKKDDGTHIDTGGGDGTGDLWVTVGGIEYFVSVRLSNAQLAKAK